MVLPNKKTVLLIGYNDWQERSLVTTLRLGGYVARVVDDIYEAINLVKVIPEVVHSIVMSGNDYHSMLIERLTALEKYKVTIPVYLVGNSFNRHKEKEAIAKNIKFINILCCSSSQLLEILDK